MKLKKYEFKKINSTNDVAIRKIKSGANIGVVIAEKQTKGRGRYGNKWISIKGNLFMTFFFQIKDNMNLKELTIKNCKIIKSSLQKLTKYKITIKPPNDLLINKEKICGVLQETFFRNKKKFLLVGIGLNLVQSPKIKNYPTNYLNNYTFKKVNKSMVFKSIKNLYEKEIKYLK